MTAYVQPGIREQVADSGMDAFLAKPFSARELLAAISGAQARPSTAQDPDVAEPDGSAIDMEDLLRRVEGNEAFAMELLELYRSESLTRLSEAINAVESSDMTALKTAAHTLKGTAGQVSAKRVAHQSRLLEHGSADAGADFAPLLQRLQAGVEESHAAIDAIQAGYRP